MIDINNKMINKIKDSNNYLIFDMDGTLIDSMPYWYISAHKELSKFIDLEYTEDTREMRKRIWANYPKISKEQADKFWPAWYHNMYELYKKVSLKDNVYEFLKRCKEEGKHLAVCTGSPLDMARQVLTDLKVIDMFDFVTSSYGTGIKKESGQIFIDAKERWNVNYNEISIYEDLLDNLIKPYELGFKCIGVYDASSEYSEEDFNKYTHLYIREYKELL